MDDADAAQPLEELALRAAVAAMRRVGGRNEGTDCLACGEVIPEGRRRAVPGCELCFECQDRLERGMGR